MGYDESAWQMLTQHPYWCPMDIRFFWYIQVLTWNPSSREGVLTWQMADPPRSLCCSLLASAEARYEGAMGQVVRLKEDLREAEVAKKHTEATAVSARAAAEEATANARRAERRVRREVLSVFFVRIFFFVFFVFFLYIVWL